MVKRPNSRREPAESEHRPTPKRRPRKQVRVTCPACGTRFKTPGGRAETPCLNCDKPVPVRTRKEASSDEEDLDDSDGRNASKPDVFGAMAEERFGGEVYRPTFPFLEGTFSFPWYPESVVRWVGLSLGCAMSVLLYVAMHWCFSRGGWFARAGYAFGFPFGWISVWTYSYAASCGTAILTETAAGNDRITGWPEPDWREWMGDFLALFPAILTAVSLAFGAGKLSELLGGPFWTAGGIALFFVLPVCLLSTIEAHSPFVPFSPLVLKSLPICGWAWARLFAASAALAALWPGCLILGYQKEPFYAAVVTAPLMATSLLVYPRLLGRLATFIAELEVETAESDE